MGDGARVDGKGGKISLGAIEGIEAPDPFFYFTPGEPLRIELTG
jgi:hypothetical protein